jgi:enoyl-CoA hydratase/carnithine racemase
LEVDIAAGVARIRLNRPDQRNAISRVMLSELRDVALRISAMDDARVAIIEAAGPAFSAGVDLDDFESFMGHGESAEDLLGGAESAITMASLGRDTARAIVGMRQMTVSKVQGYAVGAGMVVALAADLRVISDDAYYWIPEVELGTPLVWGAIPMLVAEIGPARTKDLVATCRRVPAMEALALGLATKVVPPEEIDVATNELAEGIAGRPWYAIEATKSHVGAVARAMVAGDTSYADKYLQAASWLDRDVRARAQQYLMRFRSGERGGN